MNGTIKVRIQAEMEMMNLTWDLSIANSKLDWIKNYINTTFNYSESGKPNVFELYDANVFGPLEYIIATRVTRYVGKGNTIQIDKKQYQPYKPNEDIQVNFKPRTEAVFVSLLSGNKIISIDNRIYRARYINEPLQRVSFPATPSQLRYLKSGSFKEYRNAHKVISNSLYETNVKGGL